MAFKIGDRVVHKLTGQKMTINKISKDGVAVLKKDIPEPYKFFGIEYPGDIAICILDHEK